MCGRCTQSSCWLNLWSSLTSFLCSACYVFNLWFCVKLPSGNPDGFAFIIKLQSPNKEQQINDLLLSDYEDLNLRTGHQVGFVRDLRDAPLWGSTYLFNSSMISSIRHLTLIEVSIATGLEIMSMILTGSLTITLQPPELSS